MLKSSLYRSSCIPQNSNLQSCHHWPPSGEQFKFLAPAQSTEMPLLAGSRYTLAFFFFFLPAPVQISGPTCLNADTLHIALQIWTRTCCLVADQAALSSQVLVLQPPLDPSPPKVIFYLKPSWFLPNLSQDHCWLPRHLPGSRLCCQKQELAVTVGISLPYRGHE